MPQHGRAALRVSARDKLQFEVAASFQVANPYSKLSAEFR
jgi:hypothetical protein